MVATQTTDNKYSSFTFSNRFEVDIVNIMAKYIKFSAVQILHTEF